jgi:hypothetical protein
MFCRAKGLIPNPPNTLPLSHLMDGQISRTYMMHTQCKQITVIALLVDALDKVTMYDMHDKVIIHDKCITTSTCGSTNIILVV